MSTQYEQVLEHLRAEPETWLITGAAGFIGSNLLEVLLRLGQKVVGLDNFSTGSEQNLKEVRNIVGDRYWRNFRFVNGDITNPQDCKGAVRGVDYVLHQAALGSVPRSISDPVSTDRTNVGGFLNVLVAAEEAGVKRFVYASSSATYGDHHELPKVEDRIGQPLSPYAVTKYVNELYASVFVRLHGLETIGLRYFNVFGERQDPNGAYAAVIPRWIGNLLDNQPCTINGDGRTTRDFCYAANVVQANLLAAKATREDAANQVYNVAFGERTTLNELYVIIRDNLAQLRPDLKFVANLEPVYGPFRSGDVRHSLADVGKASRLLVYSPTHSVEDGLKRAIRWYVSRS